MLLSAGAVREHKNNACHDSESPVSEMFEDRNVPAPADNLLFQLSYKLPL